MGWTKFEKQLSIIISFMILCFAIVNIAAINHVITEQKKIAHLNTQLQNMEANNNNLKGIINELSTDDRLKTIAFNHNLDLNQKAIKNVNRNQ